MSVAFGVYYTMILIGLLYYANRHGQKKDGTYNFWENLISSALSLILLWWIAGWRMW